VFNNTALRKILEPMYSTVTGQGLLEQNAQRAAV